MEGVTTRVALRPQNVLKAWTQEDARPPGPRQQRAYPQRPVSLYDNLKQQNHGANGNGCSTGTTSVSKVEQVGPRRKRRPAPAPGTAKSDEAKKLECIEKLRSGDYSLVENVQLPTDEKWKSKVQVGTGNTKNLTDHCCKPENTHVLDPLPRNVRSTVAGLLAALSAENFLPFTLCESESFRNLAAYLVEIGFKHGVVKHEDILSKNGSHKAKAKADEARNGLVEEIREDLENGLLSGTIDGWTDDQKHRKYMAHTISHISKDTWELQDNLLCLPHCDAESVTHEVIDEIVKIEKIKMNIDPGEGG
ncbi:hypothetical protein FOCC_FOCC006583 [Frankliniella occidentalis]|nr:hypothetical protein FOCC_FOCC006583 [Frankliniella occidentalis]